MAVGSAEPSGSATPAEEPAEKAEAIAVDTFELLEEYKNNEVRADAKWKGKRLLVAGFVGDVKKDITGNIYVAIGTKKDGGLEVPRAQCFFDKEHEEKAAALNKGDAVAVECDCEGLMMNVIMKNCSFKVTKPKG